jgi:Trp operon repressor
VHGAIDGYSRLVTFLKASTNNKASTVLDLFLTAEEEYGLPSRIRVDKGGENHSVCRYMEEKRGTGRGSAIRGRSVHNQRIERLWLDVWDNIVNVYYDLFSAFERDLVLNPNSEEQVFALHYVYMPRIRRSIQTFVMQHNHQKIRTENASPLQMFVARSLELHGSTDTAMREVFAVRADENPDEQNVDESDGENNEDDNEDDTTLTIVEVPETRRPLTDEECTELSNIVDPLSDDVEDDKGLSKYFEVLDFISQKNGFGQ